MLPFASRQCRRSFSAKKAHFDPVMFPPHKRFWDLAPKDLSSSPDSGLFLVGSEFRSNKPNNLDFPEKDNYLSKIQMSPTSPMQWGIKPLTYGRVITISRRAKVTKADRVQSYGALVLGGNGNGVGGYGYGRGKGPQEALVDAEKKMHLNLQTLPLYEDYTIFHSVVGYFKRTVAIIRPAPDGRGLQAGKLGHGIMACFGIKNASCKMFGQNNIYSQTKAIYKALSLVRSAEEFSLARGRKLWELNRKWLDRPARFLDYEKPEVVRAHEQAQRHEERVREVRRILVNMGRDEVEDLLSTPQGLRAYVDALTLERVAVGDKVPWLDELDERVAMSAAAASPVNAAPGSSPGDANANADDAEFDDDEVIYRDKHLVD